MVEEWTIRIKLPTLSGTLVRVWEVDDGDGWMSVDATSNQPLSDEQANFADADETCGGDEYAKSAVAGWTRK